MSKSLKTKQITLPLGVIAALLGIGILVSLFAVDGFIGRIIALGLLGLNVVWSIKLFASRKSEFKKMVGNSDALMEGLKGRLVVPLLYVVSLVVAVFLPAVLALIKVALTLAFIAAGVALVVFGLLYVLGRIDAKKTSTN